MTRLAREGIIARDFAVGAMLEREHPKWPIRSAQRHFVRSTGITHRTLRQIERARYATMLLKQGLSILDTVDAAGYFDQPHLTRSLKTLIGSTPAEISRSTHQLSFLYKTTPLPPLVCLVLYLVPRTSVLGALLMTGYLGGAVATHVRISSPLLTHTLFPVYVALLLWGGLYFREPRLRALVPLRRSR